MANTTIEIDPHPIFSPLQIGHIAIANRLCHAATLTNLAEGNAPSVALIEYYARRAKGGVGLIVTEIIAVHPTSVPTGVIMSITNPRTFDGLKRIADGVHGHGSRVVGQIWHSGRQQLWTPVSAPWAPSGIADPMSGVIPHEMTLAQVREIRDSFVSTALQLQKAGFDGVELHGAHGYLINQFLAPWSNHRDDEYGGSLENRTRFLREVILGVREACGTKFVVGLKLNGDDFIEGGVTPEETQGTAQILERSAKVDYIGISQGNFSRSLQYHVPGMHHPPTPFSYLAQGVKRVAGSTPVGSMGRVRDIDEAKGLLDRGHADFVAMSRPLLIDPDVPVKARTGRASEIRRCIYCNVCWHRVQTAQKIACVYYPELGGKEPDGEERRKLDNPKRVVVIGGGPAGMAAAYRAALLGHAVTLFEESAEVGGQVRAVAKLPGQSEFMHLVAYYAQRLSGLGVEVRLNVHVGADEIEKLKPDGIVVACGSKPGMPDWQTDGTVRAIAAVDLFDREKEVGNTVMIVDHEGGATAPRLAEWLGARGKLAVIITNFDLLAKTTDLLTRQAVYGSIRSRGIEFLTDSSVQQLSQGAALVKDLYGNEERRMEIDTIVSVGGHRARTELGRDLERLKIPFETVGDCFAPRTIISAVHEGDRAARKYDQGGAG